MDNPQKHEQWLKDRCGNVGASKVADIIAKTKTGYSASRANYMADLIVERLTGASQGGYTNAAMQWGTEKEPEARGMYKFITDNDVTLTGFVMHPSIPRSGASPDGIVGEGLVEIKCPNTATHIETLLGSSIDGKYITQMQWQMACTGAKWCDFVSFDPRLPSELQIKIQRVIRDDDYIAMLESEVIKFQEELTEKIKQLENVK